MSGVSGYWLISDPSTGKSGIVNAAGSNTAVVPALTTGQLSSLGAQTDKGLKSYFLGGTKAGDLGSRLFRAIGELNISVDTIPLISSQSLNGLQPGGFKEISGGSSSYLQPLYPGSVTQPVQSAGAAAQSATQTAGSAIGSVTSSIGSIGALFTNLSLWKGLGFVIAGGLVLIFALFQLGKIGR